MSQTITRLYGSHQHAVDAVNELRKYGFGDEDIHVVGGNGATTMSLAEVAAAIMKGYVLKSEAMVYAEGVRRGGTLVTVHAPIGTAGRVIRILDSFAPTESGVAEPPGDFVTWDEAAPLSSALHFRTLLDDSATFSRFWNVPVLTKGRASLSAALGMPELKEAGPMQSSFGLPLLSDNPAPLSSLLHLPLLKGGR
jgi:hypothetical protein